MIIFFNFYYYFFGNFLFFSVFDDFFAFLENWKKNDPSSLAMTSGSGLDPFVRPVRVVSTEGVQHKLSQDYLALDCSNPSRSTRSFLSLVTVRSSIL
jgi:hypothetical protein